MLTLAALTKPVLVTAGLTALVWFTGKPQIQTAPPLDDVPPPPPGPPNIPPDVDPPLPENQADSAAVLASVLNVRSEPSSSSGVIAKVTRGQLVSLIDAPFAPQNAGETYPWWFVQIPGGQQGWVYSQYISLSRGSVPKDEEEKNRRLSERDRPIFQGKAGFGWYAPQPLRQSATSYVRTLSPHGAPLYAQPDARSQRIGTLVPGGTARLLQNLGQWSRILVSDRGRAIEAWVPRRSLVLA